MVVQSIDDIAKITTQLEYQFLKQIIASLRGNAIDVPTAKVLASSFLKMEPFSSIEDAKNKLIDFVKTNPAFTTLKDLIESYNEEKQIGGVIEKINKHLKAKEYNEAAEVVNPSKSI